MNICSTIVCAGLVISYWGGKYMALRRAQKPSALGDEVTGAINLLVRLLPLVQMILMHHLYFQVCCLPCLAPLHTTYIPFSASALL